MRRTFWYIVGGQLATIAIPALAQDAEPVERPDPAVVPDRIGEAEPTPDRMSVLEAWPAERQLAFRQWPAAVQAYFWTLPAPRQEAFWRLDDATRQSLATKDEMSRGAAWAEIERREP